MIKQISHICIESYDLQKTLDFYCNGLQLEKKFEFKNRDGEIIGFYLALGNKTFLEIFKVKADKTVNNTTPIKHLCLEVEDIDVLQKHLTSQGIFFTDKKIGEDKSWQFWCTDPNGVEIEFQQYTESSCQNTGDDCTVHWE